MSTTFYRGENPLYADKLNTAFSERVSRGGDTMQGFLKLAADPVQPFDAATKQYVDRFTAMGVPTGAYIGPSPPGNTLAPLWWDNVSGQLFIQYNDGNSTQWVSANSATAAHFPLDGGSLTGPLYWIATGSTASRSAQDRSADRMNVRDFGAKMDGTNDGAAFLATYNATPANGTVYVPAGTWNTGSTSFVRDAGSGNVRFMVEGNNGIIQYQGDGDIVETMLVGRKGFYKQMLTSNNGFCTVQVGLVNNNPTSFAPPAIPAVTVVSGLIAGASAYAGSSGYTWTHNVNLESHNGDWAAPNSTQNVAIASRVHKHGPAATWQFFGSTQEFTGLDATATGNLIGFEMDLSANGPESPGSSYDPHLGGRVAINFACSAFKPTAWLANHAYAVASVGAATVVGLVQPTTANGFVYRCLVAGTSGSTEPVWPHPTGTIPTLWTATTAFVSGAAIKPDGVPYIYTAQNSGTTSGTTEPVWPTTPGGTVTDGSITWKIVTVNDGTVTWSAHILAMQFGRILNVAGDNSMSIGAFLYTNSNYYDAILEFSQATLADGGVKDAGIRLAANMPIDFSGNGTAAGQNNHTLRYTTSGTPRLSYMAGATEALAISDNGGLASPSLPINVMFYGAKLDGTTDTAAFQAARNVPVPGGGRIRVPAGKLAIGNIVAPPASSVIWELDAYTGAGASSDFNLFHEQFDTDIVHTTNQGEWWYQRNTSTTFGEGVGPLMRLDRRITHNGGTGWSAIVLNDTWFEGCHPSGQMTGLTINTQLTSSTATTGPSVGLYVHTDKRAGTVSAWASNIAITDWTGGVSAGSMIGMEMGVSGNGHWTGYLSGGIDFVTNTPTPIASGGAPSQQGFCVRASNFNADMTIGGWDIPFMFGHTNAYVAAFGGLGNIAAGAVGFDASQMTFSDAVKIAMRVGSGNVIDVTGNASAYLQYRTATSRLYYVVAGVDQWSIDASGNVRARGTVTGSTTP